MPNQFNKVMQKKTNEQLLKIINSPGGDYQAEALEAANAELNSRDLSKAYLAGASQALQAEQEYKDEKANEPLGNIWKVLCFLLPGGIQIGFAANFKANGYNTKAKEIGKWTLYGVGFYIAIMLLSKFTNFI